METNESSSPLLAVNLPHGADAPPGSRVLRVEIPIFEQTVSVRVHVADVQARLADVVLLARWLDGQITQSAIDQFGARGCNVSCTKGCCHCCSYLIPLSLPEAFALWDDLLAMTENRRSQLSSRFVGSAKRLLNEPFAPGTGSDDPEVVEQLAAWYTGLDMPCPLLEDGLCSEYPIRPLACREYMVVSPPEHCDGRSPRSATRVDLPVSIAESCMELAASMEAREPEGVILTGMLAWLGDNLWRHEETYPAIEMFSTFLQIVCRRVRRDLSIPALNGNESAGPGEATGAA